MSKIKRKYTPQQSTYPTPDNEYMNSDLNQQTQSNQSQFLIIKTTSDKHKQVGTLSPFVIEKQIQGLIGNPKTVKSLRDGTILVECIKQSHTTNALKIKSFHNLEVSVALQKTLNSSKGIIRCPALRGGSEETIHSELQDQHVTTVTRITRKEQQQTIPTNTLIITFSTPKVPKTLKVGHLIVPVEVYIPNPLRCFRCQRFGHHKTRCNRSEQCAHCACDHHTEDCQMEMDLPFRCINCDGAHQAYSKTCPKWQTEKEILRVKHTQNISFQDARKTVEALTLHKTYASTVKQSTLHTTKTCSETQTETHIQGNKIKPNTNITSKSDRWWNLGPLIEGPSVRRVSSKTTTKEIQTQPIQTKVIQKQTPRTKINLTENKKQSGNGVKMGVQPSVSTKNRFGDLEEVAAPSVEGMDVCAASGGMEGVTVFTGSPDNSTNASTRFKDSDRVRESPCEGSSNAVGGLSKSVLDYRQRVSESVQGTSAYHDNGDPKTTEEFLRDCDRNMRTGVHIPPTSSPIRHPE